jgi:hypothetical protein
LTPQEREAKRKAYGKKDRREKKKLRAAADLIMLIRTDVVLGLTYSGGEGKWTKNLEEAGENSKTRKMPPIY